MGVGERETAPPRLFSSGRCIATARSSAQEVPQSDSGSSRDGGGQQYDEQPPDSVEGGTEVVDLPLEVSWHLSPYGFPREFLLIARAPSISTCIRGPGFPVPRHRFGMVGECRETETSVLCYIIPELCRRIRKRWPGWDESGKRQVAQPGNRLLQLEVSRRNQYS